MSTEQLEFCVGELVEVEARTWPGINKSGGIGRIIRVDQQEETIDVNYVLGGREKNIPLQYVSLSENYQESSSSLAGRNLRDRSMLLGRCRTCGSLRQDCGSCDWAREVQKQTSFLPAVTKFNITYKKGRLSVANEADTSSSDDSILMSREPWRKISRRRSGSSENSSSSGNNSFHIDFLSRRRRIQRNIAFLDRSVRETGPSRNPEFQRFQSSDRTDGTDAKSVKNAQSNSTIHSTLAMFDGLEHKTAPKSLNDPDCRQSIQNGVENFDEDEKSDSKRRNQAVRNFTGEVIVHDDFGDDEISQTLDDDCSPPATSHTEAGSPAFSALMLQHKQDVSKPSDTMLCDDDLGGFIQPEGAATSLPNDTMDTTRGLSFVNLPSFFENTLQRVQDLLPEVHAAFDDIQLRVETRKAVNGSWEDLEEEAWMLYESTKDDLVLNSLDQCRIVSRRLNSRNEYRKHKPTMTNRQKRQFTEASQNARDFAFDQIENEVESFLKNLRNYMYNLRDSKTENDGVLGDVDSDEDHDEAIDEEPPIVSIEGTTVNEQTSDVDRNTPFHPHMYASLVRKRKKKSQENRFSSKVIRGRKKRISGDLTHENKDKASRDAITGVSRQDPDEIEHGVGKSILKGRPSKRRIDELDKKLRGALVASTAKTYVGMKDNAGYGKQIQDTREAFAQNYEYLSDSAIPCLEDIISTKKVKMQPLLTRHQHTDNINQKKTRTARERMEAFLDKNSLSLENEDSEQLSTQLRVEQISKPIQNNTQDSLIFEHLKNNALQRNSRTEIHSHGTLSEALSVLQSSCPLSCEEEKAMRESIRSVEMGSTLSRNDALVIFSVAKKYFLRRCTTLQEHIATDHGSVLRHVKTLCSMFIILEMNLQKKLEPSDGVLFKIFASDSPSPFVQITILQLLDALFAFFHPQAWASDYKIYEKIDILRCFAPLRNAISVTASLLELSCQYILTKLECQKRWESRCGSKIFVSSIDPAFYRNVWETGEMTKPSTSVRIKMLGSKLPRIEVEAIWSIVGYLAGAKMKVEPKISRFRWRLLYFIMCCDTGVLPKSVEAKEKSIATDEHAKRCERELYYLTLLVSRGDMNPLRETDKLITILMKRAILLQTRHCRFNDLCGLFGIEECLLEKTVVLSHWDASNLLTVSNPNSEENKINNELTSLSRILRSAVELLRMWVRQANSNPVLLSQLASSIRGVESLEEHFGGDDQNGNGFGQVFSAPDAPTFVRVASLQVLLAFDFFRNECASQTGKTVFTTNALKKLWHETSSQEMKIYQESLLKAQTIGDSPAIGKSSFFACFAAMRSIVTFTFGHLGLICGYSDVGFANASVGSKNSLDRSQAPYQYVLRNAISCIMAALDGMCKSMIKFTSNTLPETPKLQMRALTLSLIWISQIFSYCRFIYTKSDTGLFHQQILSEVESVGASVINLSCNALRCCVLTILSNASYEKADFCFRACLTAIRGAAAWASDIFVTNSNSENNDEFGDFDDTIFLNIEPTAVMEPPAKVLCTLIQKLLALGDPSKRYDIQTNTVGIPDDIADCVRSHGRRVITRFSGGLCSCLASLVAVIGEECELDGVILVAKKVMDPTGHFAKNVSIAFLTETCKLARKHSLCQKFIVDRLDNVLVNFFVALLDAGSIERFPSCDCRAMNKLAGTKGERRERQYLSMLNGNGGSFRSIGIKKNEEIDEVGSVYTSTNLWGFYECILNVAKGHPSSAFSRLISTMDSFDPSLYDRNGSLPRSIEQECLKRLCLLQSFFIIPVDKKVLEVIEDMLLLVLKIAILNILQISDGLKYLDASSMTNAKEVKTVSYKCGKLKLLLAVYIDMFLAKVTSVTLMNWENYSSRFKSIVSNLREVLIFQVTQSDETNIEEMFRNFCLIKSRQFVSKNQGATSVLFDLRRGVKIACIRRCREIVRHLSTSSDDKRGVIALVASITSLNDARLSPESASSLLSRSFDSCDSHVEASYNRLVFEEYVDNRMVQCLQMLSSETKLKELRKFLLTQVLPPRIRNARVSFCSKVAYLNLANRFLQKEIDEKIQSDFLNWVYVHGIMSSNWTLMQQCLNAGNLPHDLVTQILRCMSLVMGLPFGFSGDVRSTSLINWCYGVVTQLHNDGASEPLQEFSDIQVFSFYTLTLVMVMKHLAKIFIGSSPESGREEVHKISKLTAIPMPSKDHIRLPSVAPFDIETALSQLHSFNNVLLAKRDNASSTIENVYSKNKKKASDNESIKAKEYEYSKLQREARNLIAIVSSVCSEL